MRKEGIHIECYAYELVAVLFCAPKFGYSRARGEDLGDE